MSLLLQISWSPWNGCFLLDSLEYYRTIWITWNQALDPWWSPPSAWIGSTIIPVTGQPLKIMIIPPSVWYKVALSSIFNITLLQIQHHRCLHRSHDVPSGCKMVTWPDWPQWPLQPWQDIVCPQLSFLARAPQEGIGTWGLSWKGDDGLQGNQRSLSHTTSRK